MSRIKDLTGQQFGRLTVIDRAEDKFRPSGYKVIRWNCICSCEDHKMVTVDGAELKSGGTKSCGCLKKESDKKNLIDLTGKKFGRLTVIDRAPNGNCTNARWNCKCECGEMTIVIACNLTRGQTKSCGCIARELSSKRLKKYNTYNISGNYGIGYTLNGEEFYFDLEDYEKIKEHCWCIKYDDDGFGYVVATINGKMLRMHRYLMNPTSEFLIDHINHNTTDNRKANLRIVTPGQNAMNRTTCINNKVGVNGVSWDNEIKKWKSKITYNGNETYLGIFNDINEAIKSRKLAEEQYYGKYSYDNSMIISEEIV